MFRTRSTRRHRLGAAVLSAALAAATLAAAPTPASADEPNRGPASYVAPWGNDDANGSPNHPWATIAHAQEMVRPGDTVYLRGGTYAFTDAVDECASRTDSIDVIALTKSGTAQRPIRYAAAEGETPVLDFAGILDDCRVKGINVSADHVVLERLEVTGVRQGNNLNNESWGVWVAGNDNVFDRLNVHHIMGAGIFIQDGAGNLVRNSDSHDNYDPYSKTGAGQNADGFGSHTDTPSTRPNVFSGDRAWNNADDGFDFINSSSPASVRNSWAWHNGYVYGTDVPAASGNGNGFKLGGFGGVYDPNGQTFAIDHSVAFDNRVRGFDANYHTVPNVISNNTAFDNGTNYDMTSTAPDGTRYGLGILRNNVSFGTGGLRNMTGTDSQANSWDLGLQLTAADFLSVSQEGWDAPRKPNGDLPDLPNLRPAPGSALIDRGVDLGFRYRGSAPDLGAFEFDGRPHGE
ncbi:right-handed parallel beta-helix repeat-containing protein [Actinopolymorpha pittospori]|uniref:Pel9A-like right handed beta-helix region domain-containing protein n=1 Tax=Actinopolymorpha pittospori TaxID=648752 RepID=A0A927N1G6_9ACTN|nr:right-handed parallel beta-helix repeat-containing protein [Actinopolymorpha pittospori]MBE1608563.1 hypothetical protein [Actinopolymorpha pittospori]